MSFGYSIFCCPRAFAGKVGMRQHHALVTWLRQDPAPEIVLVGSDPGVAEAAHANGLVHTPLVEMDEYGTPTVRGIWWAGEGVATHDVVAYVNADIMLVGFGRALDAVAAAFPGPFLMVGRRWDVQVDRPLTFNGAWEASLICLARTAGQMHSAGAVDYFAYRKGTWGEIPPFVVGRSAWDNWLVGRALELGWDVVDATGAAWAVHQDVPGAVHEPISAERLEQRRRNRVWYDEARARHGHTGTSKEASWALAEGWRVVKR